MTNPLVSITLATYNVAPFIEEAMESICGQSYKELEIICIDDGSSDATLEILNEYAAKDARIRVIAKKKNEGLAVARNLSLKEATGKYILFVDGDDLMHLDLVKKAVTLMEQDQSDIAVWDYQTFYQLKDLKSAKTSISQLSYIDREDTLALLKRPAFAWVKMYKRESLLRLGIHFPKGLTRQDIPVYWHILISDLTRSILPEKLSYYRQQPDATTAQKGRKLLDIAQIQLEVKKVLDNTNQYEKYKNIYLEQQLNMLHGMYDNVKDKLKNEAERLIISQYGQDQKEYVYSSHTMRQVARLYYKKKDGDLLARIQYSLWMLIREMYRVVKR